MTTATITTVQDPPAHVDTSAVDHAPPPADADAVYAEAYALAQQPGRELEAEVAYHEAIAAGSDYSWFALGYLLAQQPDRGRDAEDAYRAAMRADDDEGAASAAACLAYSLDQRGDVSGAIAAHRVVVGRSADEHAVEHAGERLGWLLGRLGDRAGARAAFQPVLRSRLERTGKDVSECRCDEKLAAIMAYAATHRWAYVVFRGVRAVICPIAARLQGKARCPQFAA